MRSDSGSGGRGPSRSAGRRIVPVVRSTRSVVVAAASRVAVTIPAMDAPVSSSTPASSRNMNRMCEPAVENSLAEAQNRDSPTSPPWCSR